MAVFMFTAVVAYWVAYDPVAAWLKLRLLLGGALLFYAIITQPRTNLGFLAGFWIIFGVGVAVYFLLTLDFEVSPAKFLLINRLGLFWMSVRPALNWPAIQSGDMAAGIVLITSIYGLNFLDTEAKRTRFLVYGGFGIIFSAVTLATSRGALIALIAALGIWLAWLLIATPSLLRRELLRGRGQGLHHEIVDLRLAEP